MQTIQLSDCVENEGSQAYEDLFKEYYGCVFGDGSAYKELECDDSITELTCDGIYNYNKAQTGCLCSAYKVLYDRVSAPSQALLQQDLDEQLEGQFDDWEEILGCTINDLRCNLATGVVTDRSGAYNGKVHVVALLWAILSYILC